MATSRWMQAPGAGYSTDAVPVRYDRQSGQWLTFVGGNWVPVPPDIDLNGLGLNGDVFEVMQTPDGDFAHGSELAPNVQGAPPRVEGTAGGALAPTRVEGTAGGALAGTPRVEGTAGGALAPTPAARRDAGPGGVEGPVTDPNQPGGARYNAMLQANMAAARQAPAPGTAPAPMPSTTSAPQTPGPNLGYTNAAKGAGEQRTAQGEAAAVNAQPAQPAAPNGPNLAAMGWKWQEKPGGGGYWYDPNEVKPAPQQERFGDLSGGNVQGGTQDRVQGFAGGGVAGGMGMMQGAMPPMPQGAGKALMGEGKMRGGPDNNGWQAEIVIHPQAIEQGLVTFVDGPTETEPEPGTMIVPMPKSLQGLAHALPPMPGRPARFKDGGYIIGPRFKDGGTYGPAPMPGGGGSPAPGTPSPWDFYGGRPADPTNGRLLAAYTPSQRDLLSQEMAASGSGLNANDLSFLFNAVGPGRGSRDGTWS